MKRPTRKSILITVFCLLIFFPLLLNYVFVRASSTVTLATAGSTISADTTGGTYTTLIGPTISEGVTGDIGAGDIILNVPAGFIFDTANPKPTVLMTWLGGGDGAGGNNINNKASGTIFDVKSITTTQITFTITAPTEASAINSLTWQNIRVRPLVGTPLASGDITKTGSSVIVGVTNSGTNFGTLTEVAGVKTQVAFVVQPSTTATTTNDFVIKPSIAVQDQFGNTVISDNTTTVTHTAVLATGVCGGAAGSGSLSSTPASGTAVTAGLMEYTAMQYSFGESIKICAASSGLTSALSDTITVNNPVPVVSSILPTSKNVSADTFTLTIDGSNFLENSVVRFADSDRTTAHVSSNQLTASIPSSDLTSTGTFDITVFNPLLGGGTSNVVSFTVSETPPPDTTPPAAISNLALSAATTNSINLSWTSPGDDDNVGVATSYDIRYYTSLIDDSNWASTTQVSSEPSPAVASTTQDITVDGLNSNTTYFFAMKTSDEIPNTSILSNVTSLTTLPIAEIPSSSGGGGGGGSSASTNTITFSGQAYPSSTIRLFRASLQDKIYQAITADTVSITEDGLFEVKNRDFSNKDYFYVLQIKDKDDRKTNMSFDPNPINQNNFLINNIFVPPSLGFIKTLLNITDDLQLLGYASPLAIIEVDIDGTIQKETTFSGDDGSYALAISSTPLSVGTHYIKVRQTEESGRQSDWSITKAFKKSLLTTVTAQADFNNDGKVNITDWSIFLFRWESMDQNIKSTIDLDSSGTVDVFDLSIFLKLLIL